MTNQTCLTIRTPSGLSGDMLVAGLAAIFGADRKNLPKIIRLIGLPELKGSASLLRERRGGIVGWRLIVRIGDTAHHRDLRKIERLITASSLTPGAKKMALSAFRILARAESSVHDIPASRVEFHEVGALDSVLDILAACFFFDRLGAGRLVCSPLPVCDGVAQSAHGPLMTPAPAVLEMLTGVPVFGVPSTGETVTPTAIALLKAFGAEFGPWPSMVVTRTARVFGSRTLPGIPNGAIFALGTPYVQGKPSPRESSDRRLKSGHHGDHDHHAARKSPKA